MKRGRNIFLIIFMLVVISSFATAFCDLDVSMLNQDPYPAIPGEYVKLVFQVDGVDNPECGDINFELIPKYPISFDPTVESKVEIKAGTFVKDYGSFLMVPYQVRVDQDALDGDTPLEITYSAGATGEVSALLQFNLHIEDVLVDFEVYIKDYSLSTKILTLEILNIGDNDVEALTIEIPDQDNIQAKGSNRYIVGDLDSNDYTTAEIEADMEEGDMELIIYYNDEINTRRTVTKSIHFNPLMFEGRNGESKGFSTSTYILIILVIGYSIYWFYKRRQKKKHKKKHHIKH